MPKKIQSRGSTDLLSLNINELDLLCITHINVLHLSDDSHFFPFITTPAAPHSLCQISEELLLTPQTLFEVVTSLQKENEAIVFQRCRKPTVSFFFFFVGNSDTILITIRFMMSNYSDETSYTLCDIILDTFGRYRFQFSSWSLQDFFPVNVT